MNSRIGVIAVALAFLGTSLAGPAAAAQDKDDPKPEQRAEQPVSEAETLLFLRPHLEKMKANGALTYAYEKRGSLESPAKDKVTVKVDVAGDGVRTVTPTYLSGERAQNYPPTEGVTSNLVILYFLEADLKEMKRLTGGSTIYFQRRIRNALADAAQVKPLRFKYQGREVSGKAILIQPFVNDPQRARYEKFAGKYYEFILSDEVPGQVYQLHTIVPSSGGAGAGDPKPLIEETLTLVGADKS